MASGYQLEQCGSAYPHTYAEYVQTQRTARVINTLFRLASFGNKWTLLEHHGDETRDAGPSTLTQQRCWRNGRCEWNQSVWSEYQDIGRLPYDLFLFQ